MPVDFRSGLISFPDLGLELEVLSVEGTWGAQNPGARPDLSDAEYVYRFDATGGGVSQAADEIPGAYAYAQDFVTRFPGSGMPSGAKPELLTALASRVESVAVSAGALFSDNFNDNSIDGTKWTSTGAGTAAAPAEQNQRIEIALTQQAGTNFPTLAAITARDLTGKRTIVELVQTPLANASVFATFGLQVDTNNRAEIFYNNGNLTFRRKLAGVDSDTSVAYNSTNHHWLSIRFESSDSTIRYETAPDASGEPGTWTEQRSVAISTLAITTLKANLSAGTIASVATPGTAIFDNLVCGAYITAPTVGFTGGSGTGATATASISKGLVTTVTMTANGAGYGTLPTVTFTSTTGGSGAAATPTLATIVLGECTGSFEQDDNLYLLCGRYVLEVTSGTATGPLGGGSVKDLGAGSTADGAALFGANAYVGVAEAGRAMWRRATGGTWTELTAGPIRRRKPIKVFWKIEDPATGTYAANLQLIALDADDPRAYRHVSADPATAGNWSAAIPILNRTYPVNAVVAANRHVWFGTAGSVVDTDDRNEPLPLNEHTFSKPYDALRNGADALYRAGWLYVCHSRGLVRLKVDDGPVRDDADEFCGPGTGLSNETPVYPKDGRHGLFEMDSWIGYWCHNGTDSYVNFGKPRDELGIQGYGPLAWFLGEYYLPGERITHVRYTAPTGVNPRLWIISVDGLGAVRIRWASQPHALSPLQELLNNRNTAGTYLGTQRWATSWKFVFTKLDFNRQNARKAVWRGDLRADRLGGTNSVEVWSATEDGVPQQAGPAIANSPRGSVLPADPLDTGHNLTYELRGANAADNPIVVREWRSGAEVIEERRYSKTFTVRLRERGTSRNGHVNAEDQQAIYNQLVSVRGRPRRFIDEANEEIRGLVQDDLQDKLVDLHRYGAAEHTIERVAVFTVSRLPASVSELNLDSAPAIPGDPRAKIGQDFVVGISAVGE